MLILTRKIGETLVIAEQIKVTVLAINGNQVRIGIDAPKNIPVNRQEIQMRINQGIPRPNGNLKTADSYRY